MVGGSAAVREQAGRAGIPFLANVVRAEQEIANLIDRTGADTLISVQHPWVLAESLLQAVSMRAFNLHNAPLPSYRGHNAANHAILNGELEFAATIHWMAPEPDAGPIAFEERFSIREDETRLAPCTHARPRQVSRLSVASLMRWQRGPRFRAVLLYEGGALYPRDSLNGLRRIEHPEDLEELDRKARAFYFPPFEPAYVVVEGRKLHVVPE